MRCATRSIGGATVIVTTHILEVAERLADRIGIIADGKLLAEGTLDRAARPGRDRTSMTLEDAFIRLTRAPRAMNLACCADCGRAASPGSSSHELRLAMRNAPAARARHLDRR